MANYDGVLDLLDLARREEKIEEGKLNEHEMARSQSRDRQGVPSCSASCHNAIIIRRFQVGKSPALKLEGRSHKMIELGTTIYVRYLDHVLFKDVNPGAYAKPFTREAVGWLDHEDDDCIRLVWERFAEPVPNKEAKQRATGLVIMKSSILELRRVDQ